nr:PREDICTED: uncharacterized protein LOC108813717 isoform X3 [Raphanus sativus]
MTKITYSKHKEKTLISFYFPFAQTLLIKLTFFLVTKVLPLAMDPRLQQAAESGSIDGLYALIDENPYILENIDAVPFINTPLHVAAASGNIEFAMEMMNLKPSFARKLNTSGYSPLHLSVDKGHTDFVSWMLKHDHRLACVKERNGMTLFHYLVAVRLLLECRLVERNKVNGNGLTFLDILRNLENSGDCDLVLEQVILKTRCKEAASMPKTKALCDFLKSPFTFWTFYSTGMKRLRSNSSEEVRGAFLIVFTLIITATYQTGLQPPGGGHPSKDPTKQAFFILLWLSNTLGFYCSLFYTFSFLPLRGLFTSWYISIGTLLGVSYALAVAANSPDPVMFLMMTFGIFLLYVLYLLLLAVVGWRKHVTAPLELV